MFVARHPWTIRVGVNGANGNQQQTSLVPFQFVVITVDHFGHCLPHPTTAAGRCYERRPPLLPLVVPKCHSWALKTPSNALATLTTRRPRRRREFDGNCWVFVIAATFSGNLLLCMLIVARLIQHWKYFVNILGKENTSVYGRIIVMCVESCALTVATIVTGGVLWFAAGHIYAMVALMVLPQTCVRTSYS